MFWTSDIGRKTDGWTDRRIDEQTDHYRCPQSEALNKNPDQKSKTSVKVSLYLQYIILLCTLAQFSDINAHR